MRHFSGFLVGLLLTAALLGGAGWAVQEGLSAAAAFTLGGPRSWTALGAMAGVGLLLGLVASGRVSPMAAFVPSIVLLAWTVVYSLDPARATDLIPHDPSMPAALLEAGRGMGVLLSAGVYALVGVALFMPVLMPSRWAPRVRDEDYDEPDDGYYR
ncbi:hypothetical protein AB0D67_27405 [Streptosporangium sp. NPDC048047]|uniref:hypothetical protein n=1 Tax=Streptosporangium sp. NPDC048047 TaxID=3155748 RepID=UPI003425E11A